MNVILILLLFTRYFVVNSSEEIEKHVKTIHGNPDDIEGVTKTYVFNANLENQNEKHSRHKRAAEEQRNDTVLTKIKHLNDTHKQLMVHWVGESSSVIICLAKDPAPFSLISIPIPVSPSAVYISYDYGDTYQNKTDSFKLKNETYATLEKFYNHPKFHTHFVFTDVRHNVIFVTKDYGNTIKRYELNFTPSDITFVDSDSSTFIVLDKNDTIHRLLITEDFGKTFREAHEFVKSFNWIKDSNILLVQRFEPNGMSTIVYSKDLFKTRISHVYATNVKDFFYKGEHFFISKKSVSKDNMDLYVSYKLGKQLPCVFDTNLPIKNYFIVDVTGTRAMVAVSHNETLSNLYVSDNLGGKDGQVKFTLSLEDVFCYFPNSTWQDTWLHHVSEDAFSEVYKVEGLSGIYIASKVIDKPLSNNLGPQHLASVITFNHGASWRLITPPSVDAEYQPTNCEVTKNCSLHLSQKFSQLNPETRSINILSSKSAPGIILATGVLGTGLKGHYGVYVSLDAGLTWRQSLRDLFFFNMGDHGGILTAVNYFKSNRDTRHVLYSIDEGKTWNQTIFYDDEIRLYGLMTEPGENTTVFTMFGSLPDRHQWIIVKLDFRNVFTSQCGPDDYKPWSPSQSEEGRNYIPCIMGQQMTYNRRIPNTNCYNGQNFTGPNKIQPCECDILDFECDYGFMKLGSVPHRCVYDKTLQRYDPYKIPEKTCFPGKFFERTKGYRRISGDVCVDGFEDHYLPDSVPCPFEEIEDFLLFAQREKISRLNLKNKTIEELPIKNLKNVIAIDFDIKNNCVYWADIILDIIGRQCFREGNTPEVLVSSDLSSIEGMALDWISNTLYFVDGVRAKIEFIRTDINHSGRMRTTVLDSRILKKPRGIALHPPNGYMFWTDWSTDYPSVNRANLDGSANKTLFGKNTVIWPNGICVDYIANRIYWVDAKLDYIGSSDLHGDAFLKIISKEDVVSHPFGIAVFKYQMYWDDWKRNAIFSADKDNYTGVNVLMKPLTGLMDLKVYAHGIQFGINACTNNNSCPYTCVGLPKNKFSCLCPDGLHKKDGKCMCPGDVLPKENFICPKVNATCSSDYFSCPEDKCIPKVKRCDGEDDCLDGSDEKNCATNTCAKHYFVCGDGKCLPHYWRCDYEVDCADGSDEQNCPKKNCTQGQFLCHNGRCIADKWVCDGQNDCVDDSDEQNCNLNPPMKQCKPDEFQCKSGGVNCIPSTWRCDEEPDCRDGSDETDCFNNTCSDQQMSCGPPNNRCIYKTWICDGDKDCNDGRDEVNCTKIDVEPMKPPIKFNTKNGTCEEWMFKCANNICIPFWWKCDEADDCGDNSDEVGCSKPPLQPATTSPDFSPQICSNNMFQCLSGNCIFSGWLCDGAKDCPDGDDELHCEIADNCTSSQFKCRNDGSCIPASLVCDRKDDCPDGTDEMSCSHQQNIPGPATPSCSVGLFPCDGGSCFPLYYMCDSKIDCKDGFDEKNCSDSKRVYQVMHMGLYERGVTDTSLAVYWWIESPNNPKLQFMPSISQIGDNKWENKSLTEEQVYEFTNLKPFTKYNVTIYVKNNSTGTMFPPAKYFIAHTLEGVPSVPWNLTVTQKNSTHVLLKWKAPKEPRGIITNYFITQFEKDTHELKLNTNNNETEYLLEINLIHGQAYNFYVNATNSKSNSLKSNVVTIKYDGETFVSGITNLGLKNSTNNSIILSWKYDGQLPEGFLIKTRVGINDKPYPDLPPVKTKNTTATITLAPGILYIFQIYAYKNTFNGPLSTISATTQGIPLPQILNLQAILIRQSGTSVKLSWDRPKDSRKVKWNYGVYYGITEEDLLSKVRYRTMEEKAQIDNLDACKVYSFSVGIVGPYGYGPLSSNLINVLTQQNLLAPPTNIQVSPEGDDHLSFRVDWQPSCPHQNTSYLVELVEQVTKRKWTSEVANLTHVFKISMGGKYLVRVRTRVPGSQFSTPIYFAAPYIIPPTDLRVIPENNGSYIIFWQEKELPKEVGKYKYQVLVSPGNTFNESKAERLIVDKPPVVYTNISNNIFTFALQIKTERGMMSMSTSPISKYNEYSTGGSVLPTTTTTIIVSSLVVICLIIVISYLVIRNWRLRNSFTRFASSHYDTRSQAATFDDNGLEDEDCPQIRDRFSDDEPLVIA